LKKVSSAEFLVKKTESKFVRQEEVYQIVSGSCLRYISNLGREGSRTSGKKKVAYPVVKN